MLELLTGLILESHTLTVNVYVPSVQNPAMVSKVEILLLFFNHYLGTCSLLIDST